MTTHNSALAQEVSAPSPAEVRLKRALEHRGLMIGATVLILIVLCAVSAPLLTTHDPYQQALSDRMTPPVWNDRGSWEHVLGTDQLGRDYLARLMYGARISLTIGFGTAIISGIIFSNRRANDACVEARIPRNVNPAALYFPASV